MEPANEYSRSRRTSQRRLSGAGLSLGTTLLSTDHHVSSPNQYVSETQEYSSYMRASHHARIAAMPLLRQQQQLDLNHTRYRNNGSASASLSSQSSDLSHIAREDIRWLPYEPTPEQKFVLKEQQLAHPQQGQSLHQQDLSLLDQRQGNASASSTSTTSLLTFPNFEDLVTSALISSAAVTGSLFRAVSQTTLPPPPPQITNNIASSYLPPRHIVPPVRLRDLECGLPEMLFDGTIPNEAITTHPTLNSLSGTVAAQVSAVDRTHGVVAPSTTTSSMTYADVAAVPVHPYSAATLPALGLVVHARRMINSLMLFDNMLNPPYLSERHQAHGVVLPWSLAAACNTVPAQNSLGTQNGPGTTGSCSNSPVLVATQPDVASSVQASQAPQIPVSPTALSFPDLDKCVSSDPPRFDAVSHALDTSANAQAPGVGVCGSVGPTHITAPGSIHGSGSSISLLEKLIQKGPYEPGPKNRYRDILPNAKYRVQLAPLEPPSVVSYLIQTQQSGRCHPPSQPNSAQILQVQVPPARSPVIATPSPGQLRRSLRDSLNSVGVGVGGSIPSTKPEMGLRKHDFSQVSLSSCTINSALASSAPLPLGPPPSWQSDPRGYSYINASHVIPTLPGAKSRYIATQAPVPETMGDFWRMIWEQGAKCSVMTTKFEESGRVKAHQYWPNANNSTASNLSHSDLAALRASQSRAAVVSELLSSTNLFDTSNDVLAPEPNVRVLGAAIYGWFLVELISEVQHTSLSSNKGISNIEQMTTPSFVSPTESPRFQSQRVSPAGEHYFYERKLRITPRKTYLALLRRWLTRLPGYEAARKALHGHVLQHTQEKLAVWIDNAKIMLSMLVNELDTARQREVERHRRQRHLNSPSAGSSSGIDSDGEDRIAIISAGFGTDDDAARNTTVPGPGPSSRSILDSGIICAHQSGVPGDTTFTASSPSSTSVIDPSRSLFSRLPHHDSHHILPPSVPELGTADGDIPPPTQPQLQLSRSLQHTSISSLSSSIGMNTTVPSLSATFVAKANMPAVGNPPQSDIVDALSSSDQREPPKSSTPGTLLRPSLAVSASATCVSRLNVVTSDESSSLEVLQDSASSYTPKLQSQLDTIRSPTVTGLRLTPQSDADTKNEAAPSQGSLISTLTPTMTNGTGYLQTTSIPTPVRKVSDDTIQGPSPLFAQSNRVLHSPSELPILEPKTDLNTTTDIANEPPQTSTDDNCRVSKIQSDQSTVDTNWPSTTKKSLEFIAAYEVISRILNSKSQASPTEQKVDTSLQPLNQNERQCKLGEACGFARQMQSPAASGTAHMRDFSSKIQANKSIQLENAILALWDTYKAISSLLQNKDQFSSVVESYLAHEAQSQQDYQNQLLHLVHPESSSHSSPVTNSPEVRSHQSHISGQTLSPSQVINVENDIDLSCLAESRIVHVFHYEGWPDFGIPSEFESLAALLARTREIQQSPESTFIAAACRLPPPPSRTIAATNASSSTSSMTVNQLTRPSPSPPVWCKSCPVLMHCSAGVGRTATLAAIDQLLDFIDSFRPTSSSLSSSSSRQNLAQIASAPAFGLQDASQSRNHTSVTSTSSSENSLTDQSALTLEHEGSGVPTQLAPTQLKASPSLTELVRENTQNEFTPKADPRWLAEMDVPRLVLALRMCRAGMVQTADQLCMIVTFIRFCYAKGLFGLSRHQILLSLVAHISGSTGRSASDEPNYE